MKFEFFKPLSIYQIGQRDNQEDYIYPHYGKANAEDRLFIVCDGMGGLEKGELASQTVCDYLSEFITKYAPDDEPFNDDTFMDGLCAAYDELNAVSGSDKTSSMGTTLVFLFFHRHGCYAAHIGDSRYYHIRPTTKEIIYRSKDHSLVTELYENGEINKAETLTVKGRNVITRALQPNLQQMPSPEVVHIMDIEPDDWFYVCTDGMLEDMTDDEILDIFSEPGSTDKSIRQKLEQLTLGNADNHSAYLIHVKKVIHEIGDEAGQNDEQAARKAHKILNDDSPSRVITPKEMNTGDTTTQPPPPDHSDSGLSGTIRPRYSEEAKQNEDYRKKWSISHLLLLVALFVAGGLLSMVFFHPSDPVTPKAPVISQPKNTGTKDTGTKGTDSKVNIKDNKVNTTYGQPAVTNVIKERPQSAPAKSNKTQPTTTQKEKEEKVKNQELQENQETVKTNNVLTPATNNVAENDKDVVKDKENNNTDNNEDKDGTNKKKKKKKQTGEDNEQDGEGTNSKKTKITLTPADQSKDNNSQSPGYKLVPANKP